MFDLHLENFRSFAGTHRIPIRPLTILVGENSSGKTSLLTAIACVTDAFGFPFRPGFNEPPYDLGSFETIVNSRARKRQFSIGRLGIGDERGNARIAHYGNAHGRSVLDDYMIMGEGSRLVLDLRRRSILTEARKRIIVVPLSREFRASSIADPKWGATNSELLVPALIREASGDTDFVDLVRDVVISHPVAPVLFSTSVAPVSLGPVRSRPERVYASLSDTFSPEGRHVPFLLAQVLSDRSALLRALSQFGRDAGLFERVSIKSLTAKGGTVEIRVHMPGGESRNLADVGYGISQVLPILVQATLNPHGHFLLLQQPEVHLHPRAQAALGTFFARSVANGEVPLVVETHSDYLVDRVRQEVARGVLPPSDVALLFLERRRQGTRVHNLELDELGNITNAPPSYRAFFLKETLRTLKRRPANGRSDVPHH
jgi:hypothetical protein